MSAATLSDLKWLDRLWSFTEATSGLRAPHGRRLWWRLRYGRCTFFICHEPGEFRTVEPREPHDFIEDAPEPTNGLGLSTLVKSVVERIQIPAWDEDSLALQAAARVLTEDPEGAAARGFDEFGTIAETARANPVEQLQPAIESLQRHCLMQFKTPADRFSPALTLVLLQGTLGQWFDRCDYGDSFPLLEELVKRARRDDPTGIKQAIGDYGNNGYDAGKHWLSGALAAPGAVPAVRRLLIAHDSFRRAEHLRQLNDRFECGAVLKYSETVVNEGATCALSGVLTGVEFFVTSPDEYVERVRQHLSVRGRASTLRTLASPLSPTHPKIFAMALVAAAEAINPESIDKHTTSVLIGLSRFYDQEPYPEAILEMSWIDHRLMKIFRQRGQTHEEERYRTRLAARVAMDLHFRNNPPR
jgi:hypothetical protein